MTTVKAAAKTSVAKTTASEGATVKTAAAKAAAAAVETATATAVTAAAAAVLCESRLSDEAQGADRDRRQSRRDLLTHHLPSEPRSRSSPTVVWGRRTQPVAFEATLSHEAEPKLNALRQRPDFPLTRHQKFSRGDALRQTLHPPTARRLSVGVLV
jgi:hypothetical protein